MKAATRAAVLEGSVAYTEALRQGLSVQEAELIRLARASAAYDSFQPAPEAGLREAKWRELLWLRHGCPISALFACACLRYRGEP